MYLSEETIKIAQNAALDLAEMDLRINGSHANAPYRINVKGAYLKARVRYRKLPNGEIETTVEIYSPETVVAIGVVNGK